MDPGLLYEPPFTDLHHKGLDGVFEDNDADQIVLLLGSFNETVGVEFGAAWQLGRPKAGWAEIAVELGN